MTSTAYIFYSCAGAALFILTDMLARTLSETEVLPRAAVWRGVAAVTGGLASCACALYFKNNIAAAGAILSLAALYMVILTDLTEMEIYDICHLAIAAAGLAFVFTGYGAPLAQRLIGGLIISVPMFALAVATDGGFGMGDVKLSASCGFLLAPRAAVAGTALAVFAGGCYAIFMMASKKLDRKSRFAFGPFLAAGYALALFFGDAWAELYIEVMGLEFLFPRAMSLTMLRMVLRTR